MGNKPLDKPNFGLQTIFCWILRLLFCPATAGLRKIRPTFSSANISSFSLLTFAIVPKITSRFLPPTLSFSPARSELSLIQQNGTSPQPPSFPAYHNPPISEILTNPHGCRYTALSRVAVWSRCPKNSRKLLICHLSQSFFAFCFPALDRIRKWIIAIAHSVWVGLVVSLSQSARNSYYWLVVVVFATVWLLDFISDIGECNFSSICSDFPSSTTVPNLYHRLLVVSSTANQLS
ncbi:hypothetical protein BZA77DRAFT_289986 [Pyronema omphalodes]|nr:hypothetical protein BZA77DRAFT_289986 [Pyronema omphalodes]